MQKKDPHIIHILGLSGSLRKESYNTALLRAARTLLLEGMRMEIYDLSEIPLYNEDVRQQGYPAPVKDFRAKLAGVDAVLIATPEYNGSISGVLKNALDWASRSPDPPLSGMPAAIMGATTGNFGTTKAQVHLRAVCTSLNMHLVNRPGVLVMRARDKFDADGNLTDDVACRFLGELLDALSAWVKRLR